MLNTIANNKTDSAKKQMSLNSCVRSFGPVPNLEEYVKPDWWCRIFNSIYLKTDADVVDDSSITAKEIDLFSRILNIKPEDYILDLSCGQGRHSLEIARRGFQNVEGLDRSRYLIQKAKHQAKIEGMNVRFREGDARKLPYHPDSFDVVMILGNSFGYFETIQDDLKVLEEVYRVLKPWGKLLIDIADGDFLREQFQPRSWEWMDKHHFVCRERSLSLDKQRLISREIITHVDKGVIADQFYAERLYNESSIKELLHTAGLQNIESHGNILTDSKKNHDLGLMERRIVLTSTIRKEWTPLPKKKKINLKNIVVLLGDPTKKDPLKPSSVFDDDDFYTIDQLKDALRDLKGYNFTFLDNHDTLVNGLLQRKNKTDIVFNLCDEGYNNDARKELHIPSILEILDMQYTGSNPQCLAFCYDKSLVRGIAKEMEIPVPEAFLIVPTDSAFELPFRFPVITKPNFGDSSFGITERSVVNNIDELVNAISEIRDKFGYEKPILVEQFLTGKDLSIGIIGNPPENYNVLPIIEEDYSSLPPELPRICGYEAKWLTESPYWNIKSIPAQLPDDTEKIIIECSLKLFERLDCRDYCRFDWRLDDEGNPKILEVNPNPGWCWDGHLAKMAKISGISYSEMLASILRSTELRVGIQSPVGK